MNDINGIYKVDMLGPYGWKSFSTAFIHNGEYRSASASHFLVGSYQVDEDQFDMKGHATYFFDHGSMFGKKDATDVHIKFKGVIENNIIMGQAIAETDSKYALNFRLNKLSSLN